MHFLKIKQTKILLVQQQFNLNSRTFCRRRYAETVTGVQRDVALMFLNRYMSDAFLVSSLAVI